MSEVRSRRESRAESALVESLNKSRQINRSKKTSKSPLKDSDKSLLSPFKDDESVLLPIPPSTNQEEDDTQLVRSLPNVLKYDENYTNPNISKQKIIKKDKHMNELDKFARLLNKIAEDLERDVLNLSRIIRENVESIDNKLNDWYIKLDTDEFLKQQLEKDLLQYLQELKIIVNERDSTIEKFAVDLDNLELKRATIVGDELKILVDTLISIGHQLPNDIERIVESETYDLNLVLTANRQSHASLLGILRKKQVEKDIETLQLWENSREKWRKLRHDQGLVFFNNDITSEKYTDPKDRCNYMLRVKEKQESRFSERQAIMTQFLQFTSDNIKSDDVVALQQRISAINEQDIIAIQECYNGMLGLKEKLILDAEDRVENLRKELHTYGALHKEPDLLSISNVMSSALDDVTLTELFRLGGGLKGEFQSLVNDLRSPNIVYDKHVISMVERFEVLICGNNIKTVLDSRGRLSTLDKLRTLVVKLRGVPKGEIPGVLSSLMPDLVELVQIAEISSVFKQVVNECLTEMNVELERVKNQQLSASATASLAQGSQKTATASNPNNTASASRKKSTAEPAPTGTASRRSSTGKTGTAKSGTASDENAGFIDPALVKQWNRKLGIIFYSSDLPMNVQEACATGVSSTRQQLECNRLIDIVVLDASKKILHHMNRKYGKLINSITSFMETQAAYVNTCAVNVAEFFLKIAKMVELHREEQTNLDNRNADELWDLSEDFRIEKEDREALFQQACQRIRESVSSQELNNNFEEVLDLLEKIQNSYRTYHSKACFSADKYPLILIDEYRNYLLKISATFLTQPVKNHNLLMNYNRVFDRVIRFNKKFFEADPRAAGVEPREVVPSEDVPTEGASSEVGVEGVSEVVNNPDDPPIEPVKVEEKEVYATPLDEASSEQQAFTGKYESISSFDSLIDGLMREADSTEAEDVAAPSSSFAAKGPTARADYPFLKDPNDKFNNITTTYLVSIPLLRDDYDALTDDDKDEYNDALQKLFIPLDDASVAALNPELVNFYNDCLACYNDTKAVYATTQDPDYIRAHPPTRVYSKTVIIPDKWGRKSTQVDTVEVSELWVLSLETERDDIKKVVSNIRESVTVAIEKESFQRLDYSEKNAASKKDEFTEELEDRLRTHWPRRGRVETQIKQPREAELLSHEDKTMRYIQSIQQRMYDSQKNFISVVANGKRKCDDYINDIASLKELLSGTFRNLASLQAIDVKARTFYLAFLKENQQILDQLNKICTDDSNNIITYALDFRKVCPPQAPDNPSGGGYSESEIKEIEILVHSQCDEIRVIIEEWKKDILVLKEQQDISAKQQDEFTKLYEKCTQDVAMAEGLGQKYGAPRRRAQERIRTEISRDEKSASKVDNMLDELEKICQEVGNTKVDLLDGEEDEPNSVSFDVNNGKKELDKLKYTWNLMNNIRVAFHNRASYLRILEKVISTDKLSWITAYRIPDTSDVTKDEDTEANDENTEKFGIKATFEEIIQEVDTACRKETKDLYESEGRGNLLADGGVPESLRVWLKETQEKLIGKNGHREKAWKRFWAQVEKFEIIVARKKLNDGSNNQNEEEEESKDEECSSIVPYPSPGICLKLLTDAFILYLKYECVNRQNSFTKLTRKLDKSRDQNERLLRPKLGSPDAVDELNALNETELNRSNEYVVGVKSYLSDCIIAITEHFKSYINDGTICSKGLINMLDSIVRLDILNVPPDTAVPTKRMTMKRLRKAQRLRQIVASGGEDRSRERVWPEISLSNISAFLVEFNNVVIKPEPVIDTTTPAVPTKGGKGQPAPVAAAVTDTFSLVPDEWLKGVGKDSAIKGAVSTAHRAFIRDRDIQVNRYLEVVTFTINDINAKCNRLLAQEKSWIERWKKQVDMLRTGNL